MELTEQWKAKDRLLGCSSSLEAKEGQTITILAPDDTMLFKDEVPKGKAWTVTVVVQVVEKGE